MANSDLGPDPRQIQFSAARREQLAAMAPGMRLQWLTRQRLLPYALAHEPAGDAFTRALHQTSAADRVHQVAAMHAALRRTLTVLIPVVGKVLVLKGVALGLSCYADPHWRPVTDIDLLIAPAQRWRAHAALDAAGYTHDGYSQHGGVVQQASYREPTTGVYIDLHWALSNQPELAGRLCHAELADAAEPLPGWQGYRLSTVHALLHAVMHYAAHQPAEQRPAIWLLDMALLCAELQPQDWAVLDAKARAAGLCGLLAACLTLAAAEFTLRMPDSLLADWHLQGRQEVASQLWDPPAGGWARLRLSLLCLPGARARITWIWRRLCPPVAWMRGRYDARTPWQLLMAYLRRWRQGLRTLRVARTE